VIKLLAIDTATEQCSVALQIDADCIERCIQTPRGHADLVLPMVQELMAEAGLGFTHLDAIAFGRGPGAFTGVRIAIGVAQGLAFAAQLPLLPISDLAAVAQQGAAQIKTGEQLLVCMDARMGEVYSAVFSLTAAGLVMPFSAERVCVPEQVNMPAQELRLALGTGFRAYPLLAERYASLKPRDEALPQAREVAQLGRRDWHAGLAISAELAMPIYLRDQVVQVKATQMTAS
jgi:tRNA threonylcarbamoyladenosine biosynthesis protein TsaB